MTMMDHRGLVLASLCAQFEVRYDTHIDFPLLFIILNCSSHLYSMMMMDPSSTAKTFGGTLFPFGRAGGIGVGAIDSGRITSPGNEAFVFPHSVTVSGGTNNVDGRRPDKEVCYS